MGRCLNCREKFQPRYFLQKFCVESACRIAENEYNDNKLKEKEAKRPNLQLSKIKSVLKKCNICGEKFTPFNSFEKTCQEIDCKTQWAMSEVKKQKTAKEKKIKQDWNKEKLEMKEKLKTLSDWKKDLEKEINALVREIDREHGCIATGDKGGLMTAGHYGSVSSCPTIRFHLENIWLQSMHSNSWRAGDTIRYQEGIIKTFGKDYLDYMDSLRNIPPIKLSIEEIKEAIPKARSILKWIKLQNRKFTTEERIELRRKFNHDLGIYNN